MRMIRDHFTADVKKIVVDDKDAYDRICQIVTDDQWRSRVELYQGDQPILNATI